MQEILKFHLFAVRGSLRCDREVMSLVVTTKAIDAGLVGDLMVQAVEYRFGEGSTVQTPIEWLSDNGSCYTAIETITFAK
jgi:putative transposase